jgi:nicotinate-nucleotide--dimethylbenzimidazole phosphoribosyltransferase
MSGSAVEALLREARERLGRVGEEYALRAVERLDRLTKPRGSLGRLEEFSRRLVAITEETMPRIDRKVIFVFAGDHGVARHGVSAFPREVTRQMVLNFLSGGAGINVLARHAGAEVAVVDIGVDYDFGDAEGLIHRKVVPGTENILEGPAMSEEEALGCIRVGMDLADEYANKGYGIFGTGDMGIGNTTPSSAIASVLTGLPPAEVTGRGTGITDEILGAKIKVIEKALGVNRPDPEDAFDTLRKVGGAEIGGIAGLCIGGAMNRVPVVVDGFISTAGAMVACGMLPGVGDYLFSAHRSAENGHSAMLEKLGLRPVLDLGLRLGEGTGAALAMLMIEAGLKIYKEMATFDEAGVSGEGEDN